MKELSLNILDITENSTKAKAEFVKIEIVENTTTLTIRISDDGIGMNNITKSHIFEKFYQGDTSHSSRGLGLGLSIVSKIVEIIGGEIKCESEENKGTTMTVILK